MDFALTDEQLAVSEAAHGVFTGLVDPDRVHAVEQTVDRFDRELWRALADADLLGLAVPETQGGAGYGLTEIGQLLQAQGAVVAPVPLLATLVLGALPIASFGTEAQRARWLPGVVAGETVLTAALAGLAASPTSTPPLAASAVPDGGWALNGTELAVPQAHLAARVVVPAHTAEGGALLALVDPAASGVRLERTVTTNREIHPHLHLSDVAVGADAVLAGPGPEGRAAVHTTLLAATVALCALQVGVCEAALRQTAAYLNGRRQFGRPLSTSRARCCGRPTPPSTSRRCGSPGRTQPGASTRAATPPRRRGWPSGRRRSVGSGRSTPPSTCTAGSARTSSTQSTGTSSGENSSS